MTWHLAPSLFELRAEIDRLWPKRSKASDGTLGDDSHAARASDHNPDRDSDPMPLGAVSAMDITATDGKIRDAVMAAVCGDPRVAYVINRNKIYSASVGWKVRDYQDVTPGGDPHTKHIHVSLKQTKAAHDSTAKWFAAAAPKPPKDDNVKPYPMLKRGDVEPILVPFLKRYFGLAHINENELFGSGTEVKVKSFQRKNKLVVDGVVGPKTWAAIKAGGTLLPPGWSL